MSIVDERLVSFDESADAQHAPHPVKVCQSLSLSCVDLPVIRYHLKRDFVNFSTFQQQTVCRIIDSLAAYGCFILADGTGVGKGRCLAGLVLEMGMNALWISSSKRLKEQTAKEFEEIGGTQPEKFLFLSYHAVATTPITDLLQVVTRSPRC